jgi:low temperature requirement protein LtrA
MIGFGIGGICWIISLSFFPPIKFILWILGMSVYLSVPWIGRKRILSKAPLHTSYIPERFGSFTIIILGQIIASVVFGLESASWQLASVLTSIMAFILAIIIWGQYYRFTRTADYKCTLGSGQPYIYSHIPLIISLLILGVCSKDFISNTLINRSVNSIFCFSLILYLTSFYILQYLTIKKSKIRGISYIGGIFALLILFFVHPLSPMLTMSGIVTIFMILFGIQYFLGRHM